MQRSEDGEMAPTSFHVRPMTKEDLPSVDAVFHLAFNQQIKGTMEGPPVQGDKAYSTRFFLHGGHAAVVTDEQGQILGSVMARAWGSVGCFGPIVLHPKYWGSGAVALLMAEVDRYLLRKRVTCSEIYTFCDSPKHHHLYMKHGFFPGCISYIMKLTLADLPSGPARGARSDAAAAGEEPGSGRELSACQGAASTAAAIAATAAAVAESGAEPAVDADLWCTKYSEASEQERRAVLEDSLPQLLQPMMEGLDISCEVELVCGAAPGDEAPATGEVLLLWQGPDSLQPGGSGSRQLAAVAVLQTGPRSEAGSGNCLIKFAAAADRRCLEALLPHVFAAAAGWGCCDVEAGVNLGRLGAFECMRGTGFKVLRTGLSMATTWPDAAPPYNRPHCYMVCDFR